MKSKMIKRVYLLLPLDTFLNTFYSFFQYIYSLYLNQGTERKLLIYMCGMLQYTREIMVVTLKMLQEISRSLVI